MCILMFDFVVLLMIERVLELSNSNRMGTLLTAAAGLNLNADAVLLCNNICVGRE